MVQYSAALLVVWDDNVSLLQEICLRAAIGVVVQTGWAVCGDGMTDESC